MPEKANETIRSAMVGTPLMVTGNLTRGDFGMILVATERRPPGGRRGYAGEGDCWGSCDDRA